MKRVLIVVAIALALAGVVAPAFAADNARWARGDAHSGNFAVRLGVEDGTRRIVAMSIPVDVALDAITSLSFWRKVTQVTDGYEPVILLGIDRDGNGRYTANDFRWQFTFPNYKPRVLKGDTFLQCEHPTGVIAAPDAGFVPVDVVNDFRCYGPNADGTAYASEYEPLGFYQAGGSLTGLAGTERVKEIKIVVGGSASWSEFEVLVDALELNGAVILDEKGDRASSEKVTIR